MTPSFSVGGDDRRALVPSVTASFSQSEGGRNHGWNVSPQIAARLSGRFSSALAMSVAHNVQDNQWYGNVDDSLGTSHYTFAHLDLGIRNVETQLHLHAERIAPGLRTTTRREWCVQQYQTAFVESACR